MEQNKEIKENTENTDAAGQAYAEREKRVRQTIALQEPDRVPLVPTTGSVLALEYGVTIQDAMTDQRNLKPAVDRFLQDMQPDYFYAPDFFPKKTLDILQPININYPGKKPQYGENFTYQVTDHTFLEDEEYDVFLKDPSAFLLHRVLAKKFESLGGLGILNPYSLCGSTVMGFSAFSAPPLAAALQSLLDAGKATEEHIRNSVELIMHIAGKGYPVWGAAVASAPFDDFADNIRGLVNTVMDLKTDPELLEEAVDRYTEVSIPAAIGLAKMMHTDNIFIPLHVGIDEFMSPDDYRRYYWPPLQKMMNALIQAGITPFVFCEGNYFTRLETLKEVPAGKVVYFFEKQDMKQAKQVLGKTACIAGNIDTTLLMYGSKTEITEETKRLLDICAPGGGYMMSNSIALDNCSPANLAAWNDAVMKYGNYN